MKDTVVMVATIAGVFIAWQGLSTWRKQLHGTDNYAAATKAHRLLIRFRKGIEQVRKAATDLDDYPEPTEEELRLPDSRHTYSATLKRHFQNRIDVLRNISLELDDALIDVEVSSKAVPKEKIKALHELYNEIKILAFHYNVWMDPSENYEKAFRSHSWEKLQPKFDVLVPDDVDSDEYSKKLNCVVNELVYELQSRKSGFRFFY